MAKPRLIILIRHAQSEGNKNRDIHQSVPDHRVKLTPDGWNQAHDAGRRLRRLLRPDDKIHFFTSPYRRTRDTTEGILSTLTADSDEDGPSPFRRSAIKVYEEPRLREQDFGNFQPCSAEMERMWQERADYGHFFYRIPNGESAADAYDRVSGFNESLWRQFGEDDFASVCVLVTHGLMSRVFLMKWYHFTVEYFEDLRNVDHCEFLIMRKQDNGKYNLETKLRTWSGLKRERAAIREKEKDKDGKGKEKDGTDEVKLQRNKTFVVTRRWGGCPDGCNHTSKYLKRHDLESLRQKDIEQAAASSSKSASAHHRHRARPAVSSDDEHDHDHSHDHSHDHDDDDDDDSESAGASKKTKSKPVVEITRSTSTKTMRLDPDELVLRPARSPHLGRDFGGSYSGHASAVDSDSDSGKPNDDADDAGEAHGTGTNSHAHAEPSSPSSPPSTLHQRRRRGSILNSVEARLLQSTINSHHGRQLSASSVASSAAAVSPGIGPFVNRLGDAPPMSDAEADAARRRRRAEAEAEAAAEEEKKRKESNGKEGKGGEDLDSLGGIEAAEAADRSIRGSVY